jgi:orotate phosphoribosyltransferase
MDKQSVPTEDPVLLEKAELVLKKLLMGKSVRFGEFTLASGRKSDFFIDCKQAVLSPEGHWAVGNIMWQMVQDNFPTADAVAGVALGGCPLASAVSFKSFWSFGDSLPALYVRKAAKDHGTAALVEGRSNVPAGSKVVLLEDVVTSGGSSLRAVETLRLAEYEVLGVLAIVDREEGAAEAFKAAGVPFFPVFERKDLKEDA